MRVGREVFLRTAAILSNAKKLRRFITQIITLLTVFKVLTDFYGEVNT